MSVGMVAAGISAVGAVGGMVAGRKAQKSADAANAQAAALQQQQQDIANEQWSQYKETYQPLENQMVRESREFGTAADFERAASEAQATSMTQLGLAQERLARTPGLDPSSGAAVAAQANLALKGAALSAVGQNAAREGIRDKSWARKMDALGLGKGLVAGASNGLANANASARAIAANQQAQATTTATNVGGAIAGLGDVAQKFYAGYQKNFGGS